MTTKARQSGGRTDTDAAEETTEGTAPEAATTAAEGTTEGTAPEATTEAATPEASTEGTDSAVATGEVTNLVQQAQADQGQQGKPTRNKYPKGMVRAETGLSPEPWKEGDPVLAPPIESDGERSGAPLEIGLDASGKLRNREGAVPAAAHGDAEGNGRPVNMDEQSTRERGGNAEYGAALIGDGTGVVGTGTFRDAPDVEQPEYPSSTITRSSSNAVPMEPKDVIHATQPEHGYVQTSTDPIAAAAAVFSLAGDDTIDLQDQQGNSVKPSEFFEVPEGPMGRTYRRVKYRVSELYSVQRTKTASKRLLFIDGQLVPVDQAELLIVLHG